MAAADLLQSFLRGRLWATTVHCVLDVVSGVMASVSLDKSKLKLDFVHKVAPSDRVRGADRAGSVSTRCTLLGLFSCLALPFQRS